MDHLSWYLHTPSYEYSRAYWGIPGRGPIRFKKNENYSPSQVNDSNIGCVVQCICMIWILGRIDIE